MIFCMAHCKVRSADRFRRISQHTVFCIQHSLCWAVLWAALVSWTLNVLVGWLACLFYTFVMGCVSPLIKGKHIIVFPHSASFCVLSTFTFKFNGGRLFNLDIALLSCLLIIFGGYLLHNKMSLALSMHEPWNSLSTKDNVLWNMLNATFIFCCIGCSDKKCKFTNSNNSMV